MNILFSLIKSKERIEQSFYWRYGRWQFKRCGIHFGKNLIVNGKMIMDISANANVVVGNDCVFKSGKGINPLASNIKGVIKAHDGANIIIGNNCGFSSPIIDIRKSLIIGNYVQLGAHVSIIDSDIHFFFSNKKNGSIENIKNNPIIIEDDVLIGVNSKIYKGIKIGARSIIGAGSVVTQDVPSDVVAAGNPAKIIKYLV